VRITYIQYAGLSLDMIKKVTPEEEYMIEPEIMMDIPDDLFDRWDKNYREAIAISTELEELMRNK